MLFDFLKPKKRKKEKPAIPVPQGICLNLGCGDKKLEGYINVDVAPSRKGVVPDVLSDIRKTQFADNYADEILSVHTIEHFYYWEAAEVIAEWKRILKPGGKLVLECPNIIEAARELLKNPEQARACGKEGQHSMWVFYGDPIWKDPLMCHKWGWTPESLCAFLKDCGFRDVRIEKALFKKREPRDMRVTGIKPQEINHAS